MYNVMPPIFLQKKTEWDKNRLKVMGPESGCESAICIPSKQSLDSLVVVEEIYVLIAGAVSEVR